LTAPVIHDKVLLAVRPYLKVHFRVILAKGNVMVTKKRWNMSGEVIKVLDGLISERPNWNATQIYEEMGRQINSREDPPLIPTLRTVQSYVRANRPTDPSGPWVPTDWPGEDAAVVLKALACEMHDFVQAQVPWPTVREAELILWVTKVAPDLPASRAPRVARFYLIYEARKESTQVLDWALIHKAWTPEGVAHHLRAAIQGWIPALPWREEAVDETSPMSQESGTREEHTVQSGIPTYTPTANSEEESL
jgi:hypothetical protein